ncbi:MAG: hypothetical protein M5U28_56370 [Sandaracinaceae bacterium]|nr:hypothetical protein [Sandaracinaceae bacterium]
MWYTLDRTTGEARTDLLPVRLGTEIWQAGRETIIIGFEGTPYAGPATVCQRSRCFELSTIDPLELWQMPNSFGQTFGPVGADWNRPEALISHSSSSGLLAVDLATGRVVRPTVPHASSELESRGIPEPDLGGIRALLYDSDIELATWSSAVDTAPIR